MRGPSKAEITREAEKAAKIQFEETPRSVIARSPGQRLRRAERYDDGKRARAHGLIALRLLVGLVAISTLPKVVYINRQLKN
jgi:hypothetical protein